MYQITDHLGNVRAVIAKNGTNAVSLIAKTDYYPFGSSMPDRNVEGDYRYGYQGEFAEEDTETGMEGFELRLWDSRIGRWLTTDPMDEFYSPYLGMGNNPISKVDPTGGMTDPDPIGAQINAALGTPAIIEHQFYGGLDGSNSYTGSYFKAIVVQPVIMQPIVGNSKPPNWFSPSQTSSKSKLVNDFVGPMQEGVEPPNSESSIAALYKGDQRIYSMSNKKGTVDCSRFTQDVACQAGYSIPRVAFDQAVWYQKNGVWSDNLSNASPGDHIFWKRGKKAYHTGIVLSVTTTANGVKIKVIQAQKNNYKPGSIKVQRLMKNGEMRGFNQPFVGLGRR
ncbi:RHS repeat-associated core domain-containing protein [uncultured Lacinutrix sp.]|uniref:RHS repeat-associated core domain-containing protein n=1 Tax=uncultured Lacinutrix sp. TaxID=574032 RepID=UPI00263606E8|nr:RHS repeat-associated core domain-containing protein [uncultured Lacinutrix sp.]